MASMSGMDIGQVRSLAREMTTEAGEIKSLIASMTSQINGVEWKGQDRQRFVDEWQHRHVAALQRVVDGLQRAAREANEFASRQEQASRA